MPGNSPFFMKQWSQRLSITPTWKYRDFYSYIAIFFVRGKMLTLILCRTWRFSKPFELPCGWIKARLTMAQSGERDEKCKLKWNVRAWYIDNEKAVIKFAVESDVWTEQCFEVISYTTQWDGATFYIFHVPNKIKVSIFLLTQRSGLNLTLLQVPWQIYYYHISWN